MIKNNFLIPDWPAPNGVHAAMSLRLNGVSTDNYASLNLAQHVDDNPIAVLQNRQSLSTSLQLPSTPIWLQQTHSNLAISADNHANNCADASFTSQKNVVCAILTADCLPIILCSSEGETIAAIHAGWRGLLAGIIPNTVNSMPHKPTLAWLGIAIGACCFEVGVEVMNQFIAKNPAFSTAFKTSKQPNKYFADLYQIARIELSTANVHAVYGGNDCTVCNPKHFYSYRREPQTGRMATLIWKT